jgi:hypothetical protein
MHLEEDSKKVTSDKAFHGRSRIISMLRKSLVEASNGFVNPRVSSDARMKEMAHMRTPDLGLLNRLMYVDLLLLNNLFKEKMVAKRVRLATGIVGLIFG